MPHAMQKTIRFTVDVQLALEDLPGAILEGEVDAGDYEDWEPQEREEFLRFQRRLLQAVLDQPAVLEAVLTERAGEVAADVMQQRYLRYDSGQQMEEQLAPALQSLADDDRARVQHAINSGVFEEITDLILYDAISAVAVDLDARVAD